MDDSARQESPPAAGSGSVERRRVRRRLVQSTLFTHNPQVTEPTADLKKDNNCSEDEAGCEGEEACGSQKGRPKRKGRTTTPQKKASSAKKEKQSVNCTPPKSARKLTSLMDIEDRSPPIPNLRLEAKLTAEENSRMFAGRQIHPFFSSWKSGRKCEEVSEIDGSMCSSEGKNRDITLGPVHVFEKTQDDERLPIDWRNWKFCEDNFISGTHDLERTTSVFEGNISCLTFDNLPFVAHSCNESFHENQESLHNRPKQRCLNKTSSTDLAAQDDGHVSYSLLLESERYHETERVRFISTHAEHLSKLDVKQQDKFLQERMISYYVDRGNKPAEMLWTDKYQPKRSTEVCGNDDSVKFLSEWLHLWHQRHNHNSRYVNALDDSGSLEHSNSYHLPDSDSEYTEEEGLKNVLLIIGPIGCGKSAAIYACAEEQGFDVMEVNASECRNGALVKQRFGEALESQWLKWSPGNDLDPQKEQKCNSELPNSKIKFTMGNEVIELIQVSDEDTSYDATKADKFAMKENGVLCDRRKVKPLILFEDVDITFLEDRGFIAAIEQIADTAKGPLILTTNNSRVALPDSLDRLEMSFAMPSPEELVRHAYMVCAAEKLSIHPQLIERLVECFKGDIRKTLMHLQFWCQGNRYHQKDEQARSNAGLFDLELVHNILPKLMPWNFPSELSGLVEKEIAVSLFGMEENSNLPMVEEEFDKEALVSLFDMDHSEKALEARKEAMLSRNCSIYDDQEIFTQSIDIPCDFSRSPGTPVAFTCRKGRRKLDVVLSSDTEDENDSRIPSLSIDQQCFLTPSPSKPSEDKVENEEFCFFPCSGIQTKYEIDSQCKASFDELSCVPETTYVPETTIENETDAMSCRTISSSPQVVETEEVFTCNGLTSNLSPKHGKPLSRLHKLSDLSRTTHDVTAESYEDEEVTQYEHAEATGRGHDVMDECSRMDFRRRSVPDVVHESWKRLRVKDLRKYVSTEERDALRIIREASGMSNLISQSDTLLCRCGAVMSDCLDPRTFASEEPEFFGWCHEQWQMTSTMFQHGFCSYAKDIAAVGLNNLDGKQTVDLTSEILSLTNDKMALANMILRDMRGSSFSLDGGMGQRLNPPNTDETSRREAKSCLMDVVQSLIPPRTCLSLRGYTFHEYLSSLGNISRREASRLSQGMDKTKRRSLSMQGKDYPTLSKHGHYDVIF
ncbi:uncharacterized protein LOC116203005 isoform X2 [Punica granatum]|uniref:Uncharacterized protein LOC116203005 isoform X2 n=1 Tax=Punica granatum TaxID=22663 RepID=A0A6P8D283_PUNGR|nr:uncharacterized protein LOC116203005 isoform X2 [Punica granatum]